MQKKKTTAPDIRLIYASLHAVIKVGAKFNSCIQLNKGNVHVSKYAYRLNWIDLFI